MAEREVLTMAQVRVRQRRVGIPSLVLIFVFGVVLGVVRPFSEGWFGPLVLMSVFLVYGSLSERVGYWRRQREVLDIIGDGDG